MKGDTWLDRSAALSGLPVELPLFPLNVVLFPGMLLPMQVFEPRYREMIQRCLEREDALGGAFGVALISEGPEVGGPAEVWPVGTLATIERMEPTSDGRLAIGTRGLQRFRILERLPDNPYPRALVTLIDEEEAPRVQPGLVAEVQDLLLAYLRKVSKLTGQDWGELTMPEDPVVLGYIVGAVLPCSLPEKQQLLQAPSPAERLSDEAPMLRREVEGTFTPRIRLFNPEEIELCPN